MIARRAWAAIVLLSVLTACAPQLETVGPALHAPTLADDAVLTADDSRLPLRSWLPDTPPRAVMLALHGFNDYRAAFDEVGPQLARAGIAVYAYDQRGFGGAPAPGRWFGGDVLTGDVADVAGLLRARYPGLPLYGLGESMGGAVLLAAVTDRRPAALDGAILVAPAVWNRATLGLVERSALWLFSHLTPWFPLSGQGLNLQPSDNWAVLEKMSRDPLVLKRARIGTLHGLVDLIDQAVAGAPDLRLPTLILYGMRDDVIPKEPLCRFLTLLPADAPWRVALYPQGYHMLTRDRSAGRVIADISAWIADHRAPLPSGDEAVLDRSRLADAVAALKTCQ